MSFLYLIALAAVAVALIATLVDALRAVSRRPDWSVARRFESSLSLVHTEDRRREQLPYVGVDRRAPAAGSADEAADLKRAA